ncbi:Ig-like domain-containing protein [Flavimobilis soli]|uniref:Ig-like domain-containing protein n=1 Tax=Flavimobilis soli TaxID=442709 RepID=A0A2A9EFN6_9MICO|nr:Ig-like domain repeat protein [Flavimobilis soli]PFG37030.1 Ig-like domain-containing protein [Flavimobilis soli]
MLSSTTPARRRTTALLTALVTLGLVGLVPATAQAAVAQTLTVTVTGQPAGTTVQVDLYELNARGSSLSYRSSATTSTAGVVTFATTSGKTYSLRASSTASTYSQFLGGGDWQENATLFTTPNATTATRAFPLLGYSTVTGKVTVPAGTTIDWGEVQSHELSRSASVDSDVWINSSWASIGADGTFTVKTRPNRPVTLSASVDLTDGRTLLTTWLGGKVSNLLSQHDATVFTSAKSGGTVAGKNIALRTFASTLAVKVTGASAATSTYVTARNIGTDYTSSTTLSAGTTAGAITYLAPGTYLVNAENGDKRASTVVTVGSGTKNLSLTLGALGNPPLTYVYTDGTARVGTTITASTKVIGAPTGAKVTTYWTDGNRVIGTGPKLTVPASAHGTPIVVHSTVAAPGHVISHGSAWVGRTSTGNPPRARVAPVVSGTPQVGRTLTVSTGAWDAAGTTVAIQWTRNGAPIAGARSNRYALVGTDAGARIGVTLVATAPRQAAATLQVLTSSNVAKASSRITVKAGKRKATVRVKAAGVPAPTGKVTVRYGKKKVTKTLRAKNKGRVVVKLPRGTHKVKVSYSGSKQVLKTTSKKLKIKVR